MAKAVPRVPSDFVAFGFQWAVPPGLRHCGGFGELGVDLVLFHFHFQHVGAVGPCVLQVEARHEFLGEVFTSGHLIG